MTSKTLAGIPYMKEVTLSDTILGVAPVSLATSLRTGRKMLPANGEKEATIDTKITRLYQKC